MKALFVSACAAIGALVASVATAGCLIIWVDEPTMPKAMIEK